MMERLFRNAYTEDLNGGNRGLGDVGQIHHNDLGTGGDGDIMGNIDDQNESKFDSSLKPDRYIQASRNKLTSRSFLFSLFVQHQSRKFR